MRYTVRDGMRKSQGQMLVMAFVMVLGLACTANAAPKGYEKAIALGTAASEQAASVLGVSWSNTDAIVMTNASFASPKGNDTQGCLDGIAKATGATVGASRLITVQSRFDAPLWFAFYAPKNETCAYLEYSPEATASAFGSEKIRPRATVVQTRRIKADYLFAHPEELEAKAGEKLFGGNVFRIVTVINAAERGAGAFLLRAVQVHDHLCPGVSSGLALVSFIRDHLLTTGPQTRCFILTLKPWCKEDALTSLLNATPGKRSYAVLYPTDEQVASWPKPLSSTCSVVFTKNGDKPWHGTMLGFGFSAAQKAYGGAPYGKTVLDKLHADIWFMDNPDKAQNLVSRLKDFDLAPGQTPQSLMRPGTDVIKTLENI